VQTSGDLFWSKHGATAISSALSQAIDFCSNHADHWPLAAHAQQGDRVRRIGVLHGLDENGPLAKTSVSAFIQANVRMDLRWGVGDTNRIRAFAQELVGMQPGIILTSSTPATAAFQLETRAILIVFATVADPVVSGIVARLDRPGGNVTGFAGNEASLGGKWLELLSELRRPLPSRGRRGRSRSSLRT
jgi:putative ABC transport system substrate-binding protein